MDPVSPVVAVITTLIVSGFTAVIGYIYGRAQGRAEGHCDGWNDATMLSVKKK